MQRSRFGQAVKYQDPALRLLDYVYRTGVLPVLFRPAKVAREAEVDVGGLDVYVAACVNYRWLAIDGGTIWVTALGRVVLGKQ